MDDKKKIEKLEKEVEGLKKELDTIHKSNLWKFAKKYYYFRDQSGFKWIYKSAKVLKNEGISGFSKKAKKTLTVQYEKLKNRSVHMQQLKDILSQNEGKEIIVFIPFLDWNIPLFQRPQHIALRLAEEGYLYFFCSPNFRYDSVNGFEKLSDGAYITDRIDLVMNINKRLIWHTYSTNMNNFENIVRPRKGFKDIMLYEYIDELHEDISGEIPDYVWKRHRSMLKDESIPVVASANKLINEVEASRNKNYALITNGVQYDHFHGIERGKVDKLEKLINKNRPVVGYFGALAKWFDYDLLAELAERRPDVQFLIIGFCYDKSIEESVIKHYSNIILTGTVDYQELPLYASYFDVSMIPFVVNEITLSTSPIKLFEYMALGTPIVTTAMPECRKYKSVLIGENHEDFIEKIDKALKLREDKEYMQLVDKEALENTWSAKAKDISELLKKNLD